MDRQSDRVEIALVHEIRGFPAPAFVRDDPRFIVFRDYAEAKQKLQARGLL
jgi:hypothetical protein